MIRAELPVSTRGRAFADARSAVVGPVEVVLPEHRYGQRELTAHLMRRWKDRPKVAALAEKLHASVSVAERHLALPAEAYDELDGFGERNDAFIRVGTDLGSSAVTRAIARAGFELRDVDALFFTTVTGVATPTIDARIVNRLHLRPDIKRTPMFGLGCVGGAAGLARASDYLRAYPDHIAVLLSVELCSLTLQFGDLSVANIIASGLFADGAAALVLIGAECRNRRPSSGAPASLRSRYRARVVDTRRAFFPDTERVMGWDIGSNGFNVVLSADVPEIVQSHVADEVDALLAGRGLQRADVRHWICHPGGPKVITAIESALGLTEGTLAITRDSLATIGNLSSASVLHVLGRVQERAIPGDVGVLMAMGPGFCAELVLLSW